VISGTKKGWGRGKIISGRGEGGEGRGGESKCPL